jgi:hypothetical protein
LEEKAMNQSFHELSQLILQGVAWVLRAVETLWVWSWSQIAYVFSLSWADLPTWKVMVGMAAVLTLAVLVLVMLKHGLVALGQIVGALWTVTLTAFTFLAFVAVAGMLSRGFQWVVANVPDNFWEKFT